jgi:hypothetical protein
MRRVRQELTFMGARFVHLTQNVVRRVETICRDIPAAFYDGLDTTKHIWIQNQGDSPYYI